MFQQPSCNGTNERISRQPPAAKILPVRSFLKLPFAQLTREGRVTVFALRSSYEAFFCSGVDFGNSIGGRANFSGEGSPSARGWAGSPHLRQSAVLGGDDYGKRAGQRSERSSDRADG